jgi:hypothetical protein
MGYRSMGRVGRPAASRPVKTLTSPTLGFFCRTVATAEG